MVTCKDARPQFGKDDVDVIRFASIRFDHALDENDRSAVTRALASRDTSIASWSTAAELSYAVLRGAAIPDGEFAHALGARIDDPGLVILRIRPTFEPALGALAEAFVGPGRPRAVVGAHLAPRELVIEFEPTGRALSLVLALVDVTLAATPGRTIHPVLPIADDVLATFASLRLGDSKIDVSRVLDRYVESALSSLPAEA